MTNLNAEQVSERISRLIFEERKARGMTQVELASKLGLSQPHLSKIENHTAEPTIIQWFIFCKMLEINSDLVTDQDRYEAHLMELIKRPRKSSAQRRLAS